MNKKLLLSATASATLLLSSASPVLAVQVPEFGTCLNPQWSKIQENKGDNHGVVSIGTYSGTDSIYKSGDNVMQCLCTENGRGYQTNWLKADNLSDDQKTELKAKGWISVPYGDDWGLDKTTYLAKNIEYTCAQCTPTPTPDASVTPTSIESKTENKTETTTKKEDAPNDLAKTGNALPVALALALGGVSLAAGTGINRIKRDRKV